METLAHLIGDKHVNLTRIFPFAVVIFTTGQLVAQSPAPTTSIKAVLSPAAVLIENSKIKEVGPPPQSAVSPRNVDLKSADGALLKGTYFPAAKAGPGVLLFHQSNRTRKSWDDVTAKLAAAGINALTVDTDPKTRKQWWPGALDTAFEFLVSQPGVTRDVIGIGGAGVIGVENAVETARRHSDQVKSLVLLSGETESLDFLRQASQLPELFVADDNDEYPPIVEAMELLYVTASSPSRKFVHYSAAHEAPWLWYEPFDVGRVPARGGHGTDMFKVHSELRGIIVDWFVTTLIKTPGHAPADSVACAATLNQLQILGGAGQVEQQLAEARKKDPLAQLFPEITASTIGQDFMRAGKTKSAIDVLRIVLTAYPDSADAHETLAEAYLKNGQKDLARQHAENALAILDSHKGPASSWTDTDQYRGEIRRSAQKTLKQLSEKQG
jgi:tetratricopeptide (TPR) repeat protein